MYVISIISYQKLRITIYVVKLKLLTIVKSVQAQASILFKLIVVQIHT